MMDILFKAHFPQLNFLLIWHWYMNANIWVICKTKRNRCITPHLLWNVRTLEFADYFLDLRGKSIWEKRETSLSVVELQLCQISNCKEMRGLSGVFSCCLAKLWYVLTVNGIVENMTITTVHISFNPTFTH